MFGQIFSAIGASIGGALGGGIFSTIGRYAGKLLGGYLEKPKETIKEYHNFKNIRDVFNFTKAVYGHPIPLIFGTSRIQGKIIWASSVKSVEITSTETKYFKGNKPNKTISTTDYEYFLSYALLLCEGEIAEIGRIWANNEIINIGNYKYRLYKGTEEQLPDPLIVANSLENKVPAFRSLAYIVFEDLPLADFNNSIPVFSFEVTRKANISGYFSVEDITKSMIMIPGSGEYVYDTIIQYKLTKDSNGKVIAQKAINSHNYHNIPNSIHSLNQLFLTCPNIEWVAPVVCWLGDDLNAGKCVIKPGIEFIDPQIGYSEEWRVGKYIRETARLISRNELDYLNYGGSVNDASLVRYLEELKRRNLKIMFYPMFFMDIALKPWRGRLTGTKAEIINFFNKDEGYNNFILHYARLVKNHVDVFVIGSELIGLTSVRDGNDFPAVGELIKLAQLVKQIVGINVKVSYAADWSEYHHTKGGWYNLDPLWASPSIDFIGIDAYFPVTRTSSSTILVEDIVKGWQSGEGYEFIINEDGTKETVSPAYAWKNLRYWWENDHFNPDGSKTLWQPKMKPIWFTEFGFPSIDKATNQPNVFFDPLCFDGGLPRYSSGDVDFSIQRRAIKAFIEYWSTQEFIEQMFLWTWDARPYPAWPHMNIWFDGYLWEKGHWVNNKFGAVSLAAIILELSARCNININKIDITNIDESIEGLTFNNSITIIDAINTLRINNFFDLISSDQGKIKFVKRGFNPIYPLSSNILIKLTENSYFEVIEVAKETILTKLKLYFIDPQNEFKEGFCQVYNENFSSKTTAEIKLPLSMSYPEAERLANQILNNAYIEDKIIKFIVPINLLQLEPGDLITISYLNFQYQIRIISLWIKGFTIEITGIFDEFESYHLPLFKKKDNLTYEMPLETKLSILDLPFTFAEKENEPYLAIYLQSKQNEALYVSIENETSYSKISTLKKGSTIGTLISFEQNINSNIFLIDEISNFIVKFNDLDHIAKKSWNLAIIGNEIIKFKKFEKLQNNLFRLSNLIRGVFATERFMNLHQTGEDFLLLDKNVNLIPISSHLRRRKLCFKLGNTDLTYLLEFENNAQKPLPPFIDQCEVINNCFFISWRMRSCSMNDWAPSRVEEKYEFIIEIYNIINRFNFTTYEKNLNIAINEINLSEEVNISIMAYNPTLRTYSDKIIKTIII